jgi:hypothetical protein
MAVGFGARPDERFLGFGERSNAVDQRGNDVEVFVGEGPFQPEERPAIAAFVPPQGFHARDDRRPTTRSPWLLSTAGYGVLLDIARDEHLRPRALAAGRLVGRRGRAPPGLPRLRRSPPRRRARALHRTHRPSAARGGAVDLRARGGSRRPAPANPTRSSPPSGAPTSPCRSPRPSCTTCPCADHLADRDRERRRAAALHAGGTAALAYMNPMVCTDHPAFAEAEANGWFTKDAAGRASRYRYSTASQFLVSQVDFTSPGGRDFFGRLLRDAVDDGFDGWMEDFGEYTPEDGRSDDGTPGTAMHNLYPTLYHRTATEETASVGRPIANYVRSGWTGTAAHARIVWGGDPTTDWGFDGLESAVRNGLTMGLSGVSTWGSDIGGFFSLGSRRLTPELFKRWIQFGAVSGVMRAKSKGIAIPEKARPQVEDPDVLPLWRRYAKLRTQLLPYLESADEEYQRTGMPLMRSLALLHPDDERLRRVEDAFGFGPDLLAAPVIRPGETSRTVALPPGTWVDLWRSAGQRASDGALELKGARLLEGGRDVELPAPLDELPLLARAGTILPLLGADVDTLAPYGEGSRDLVRLADRRSRLELAIWPRGWSTARAHGTERIVSSERRGRRWVLRITGTRRRAYGVQAALGALRRPFRVCSVRVGGRKLPRSAWSRRDGVLRFTVRGRTVRAEVRGCRR